LRGPPPASLRDYLRAATAAHHRAVDARFGALLDRGESGYAWFLQASAEGVFPLEQGLADAGVATILTDWPRRTRAAALAADLADLGVPLPAPVDPPIIRGEAGILGILYVLEGSRLGAAMLTKRLAGHPSAGVRRATRYLRHGESGFWASFLAALEKSDAARRNPAAVVAGARTAFAMFGAPAPAVSEKAAANGG
jgi:heme oxygenase